MSTAGQWLRHAAARLSDAGIDTARLDAELLLMHAWHGERVHLIAHSHDELPADVLAEAERRWDGADLVFSGLPHGVSAPAVERAKAAGRRVVDLSADLRMSDRAVYGLTEVYRAALAGADLVVSRAGASTVSELCAAGKASLQVPFPGAADEHQLANARALERVKAARLLEQSEMTPERLSREIGELLHSPARLEQMERAARGLARPQAAERIAELIEGLIR